MTDNRENSNRNKLEKQNLQDEVRKRREIQKKRAAKQRAEVDGGIKQVASEDKKRTGSTQAKKQTMHPEVRAQIIAQRKAKAEKELLAKTTATADGVTKKEDESTTAKNKKNQPAALKAKKDKQAKNPSFLAKLFGFDKSKSKPNKTKPSDTKLDGKVLSDKDKLTALAKNNAKLEKHAASKNKDTTTDKGSLLAEAAKTDADLKTEATKTDADLKAEAAKADASLKTEAPKMDSGLKTPLGKAEGAKPESTQVKDAKQSVLGRQNASAKESVDGLESVLASRGIHSNSRRDLTQGLLNYPNRHSKVGPRSGLGMMGQAGKSGVANTAEPAKVNQAEAAPNFWERRLLENILMEGIKEQRARRRWRIGFTFFFIGYLLFISYLSFAPTKPKGTEVAAGGTAKSHIAVIDIEGAISSGSQYTNASTLVAAIERAKESTSNRGILIRANSPGGSPVQSSQVYLALMEYREEHPKRPVYAVVSDVCASGCYYIVSAADNIYADASSIIGSIGVISQSFGVSEAFDKLGVESRTFKAGEHKDFLSPMRGISSEEELFMQDILNKLHYNFIEAVKVGRGDRLQTDIGNLFSGLFWTGADAETLGLIDGIDTPTGVKTRFGAGVVFEDYKRQDGFERLLRRFGVESGDFIKSIFNEIQTTKMQQQYSFE